MRNRHNRETDGVRREGRGHGRGRFGHHENDSHPHGRNDGRHSGHHDGHRGGRHRLRRLFEHGDLRLVALQLIADKPRHGYEIIKAIEEKSGGVYTPSAGAVYPTLTLLEELGHLSVSDSGDGRKLYTITPEGAAALVANRKSVDAIFARIAQAEAVKESEPRIKEALRRLKHSLQLRLSQGPLDDAQVEDVVGKLDDIRAAIDQG